MRGDDPDDGVADLAAGPEGQPLLHGGIIAGLRFIRHAQVAAQHLDTHLPVVLPVISQARHRIHPGQPDRWWLIAAQFLGDRVESFVQDSSAREVHNRNLVQRDARSGRQMHRTSPSPRIRHT